MFPKGSILDKEKPELLQRLDLKHIAGAGKAGGLVADVLETPDNFPTLGPNWAARFIARVDRLA